MIAPTTEGPLSGNITLSQGAFAKPTAGYVVEEYFLAGTARSFAPTVDEAAQYTTRLVVVRPANPAAFNGTVLAEWLNVSAGADAAPDWAYLHRELVRKGFAWVGVSAQKVGIDSSSMGMPGMAALKQADPERYARLVHPGDAFAYDIFTQAGEAIRAGAILGPIRATHLLAVGESQSAAYLTTYVNEVARGGAIFDGYLIHSRFAGAAPLDGNYMISVQAMARGEASPPVFIRADIELPVMMVISETDLASPLIGYVTARQADTDRIRTWEIAGTAHADTYAMSVGALDDGTASIASLAKAFAATDRIMGMTLPTPINAAPQHHYVLQAALRALAAWVAQGILPPRAEPLRLRDNVTFALDEDGNALGGVRSPWVDVPTAILSGLGQDAPGLLRLFGTTRPFDGATLARLYPGGRVEYVGRFNKALKSAIDAGFILEDDREEIEALALAMYPAAG